MILALAAAAVAEIGAGRWDTTGVEGLPAARLLPPAPHAPPSLVIQPFHQAGRGGSLREFSNNAFNHHHGIQSPERFGAGTDPDGDGIVDEIGCADCHIPSLALSPAGAIYTEPNPYNPPGNLRPGEAPGLAVDLSSEALPQPRLKRDRDGWIHVPAYTDLKLHYLCDGPDDPNAEALDMQHPPGSAEFFAGNCDFLTKKLWGAASEPPFFHHGKFTTLRQAVLAHGAWRRRPASAMPSSSSSRACACCRRGRGSRWWTSMAGPGWGHCRIARWVPLLRRGQCPRIPDSAVSPPSKNRLKSVCPAVRAAQQQRNTNGTQDDALRGARRPRLRQPGARGIRA
ncbi:MAG: hypothetical protein ACNA8G_09255 [Gammaproteobacteria bacterium]